MEEKVIPHLFHEDLPYVVSFNAKANFVSRSRYCCQDCTKCTKFNPKSKQCMCVSITIDYPMFESYHVDSDGINVID